MGAEGEGPTAQCRAIALGISWLEPPPVGETNHTRPRRLGQLWMAAAVVPNLPTMLVDNKNIVFFVTQAPECYTRDSSASDVGASMRAPAAHRAGARGRRSLENTAGKPGIRIMTYNIHRWAGADQRLDIERLAWVIRAAGADVVALNEVLHPVTTGPVVSMPLEELARCLGLTYAFGPSGWIDYGPGWHGVVGNALLSRYPLADVTNRWLPRRTATKQRSLLGAAVAGGQGARLEVYVTHLDHAWEGTRLRQIEGALAIIGETGKPHFIVGDFNTPGFVGLRSRRLLPPVLRRLRRAGYQDAFFAVGIGNGHTFPASAPLVRFDFLFLPNRWAGGLRSAATVDHSTISHASDHRPVVIEWGWPATKGG